MEDANDEVDLAEFIDHNSSLFVVLGVFSALAIYISNLDSGSLANAPVEIRIGFAGALLLSLLLVILIYRQLLRHVGSIEDLLRAHTNIQNWDLIIFTGGASFLLPSLITPILQRLLTLYYLISLLSLLFSVPILFKIIVEIKHRIAEEGLIRDVEIVTICAVVYQGSEQYVTYIRSNPHLYGVEQFSLSHPSPVFYDVSAVIAVALRGVSVMVGMICIARMADKIGRYLRGETD